MKIALTQPARSLRQRSTIAERKLWSRLRDRRLMDFKFKRQAPRGRYVVDFLCVEANLVVELDGSQHADWRAARDSIRTRYLESQGLRVLRFWNNDVPENLEGVLSVISEALPPAQLPLTRRAKRAVLSPRGEGFAPAARYE